MKFIVDSLPYYGGTCPFCSYCDTIEEDCPRKWSKEKVCSPDNPRECCYLREIREDCFE